LNPFGVVEGNRSGKGCVPAVVGTNLRQFNIATKAVKNGLFWRSHFFQGDNNLIVCVAVMNLHCLTKALRPFNMSLKTTYLTRSTYFAFGAEKIDTGFTKRSNPRMTTECFNLCKLSIESACFFK